ncbi:MAG: NAD-dependent epimerase/dehydratase family protein [Chloroflexota bacterium]
MTCLVTGAPGWLGNALVRELVRRERPVRCLVQPGLDPTLLRTLGVEAVIGDVRDVEAVRSAALGCDIIFHCAGLIHPRRIADLFAVNVTGTANVLAAAEAAGARRFVYVSSNSAQGTCLGRAPMAEHHVNRPENAYGRSKLLAEQLVSRYHARSGLPTTIVRPTMLYGPGQPERVTRLMRMVKSGHPLVFGNGHNLRSMAYVDNVVDGLLLASEKEVAVGRTYWIADARPYTTREYLDAIASELGVRMRPLRLPAVLAAGCEMVDRSLSAAGLYNMEFHVVGESPKDIACDVTRAETELGYKPAVALPQGVALAVAWCRERGLL